MGKKRGRPPIKTKTVLLLPEESIPLFGSSKAKADARRADKYGTLPLLSLSEVEAIDAFYELCPKHYSVDHIVSMGSDYYRGLHCLKNLQYLRSDINYDKNDVLDSAWVSECDGPACKIDRDSWSFLLSTSALVRRAKVQEHLGITIDLPVVVTLSIVTVLAWNLWHVRPTEPLNPWT